MILHPFWCPNCNSSYNIKTTTNSHNKWNTKFINIFINPIVSISYLKGVWLLNGAHNKYKLRVYKGCIYANYGFIMYFVGLIIVSLISNEAGNLLAAQNWIWFIFGVPTLYLYQENMSVCIAHDTFPRMLALIFGLIFYNPFYSKRVLKNKWI